MKRTLLSLHLALASLTAYALPLGNIADPSLFSFPNDQNSLCYCGCDAVGIRNAGFGYYGDFVFNRNLELDSAPSYCIQTTQITTNAAYFVVDFFDRLDLFATLGASRLKLTARGRVFQASSTPTELYTIESNTDFSWSLGGKLVLWECGCFGLGAEGQYFFTNPNLSAMRNTLVTDVHPSGINMKYQEWQVGLGAYSIYNCECTSLTFIPYTGVKWSQAQLTMDHARFAEVVPSFTESYTLGNFEASRHVGYAIGLGILFCDFIEVNVEGRFADEKAVSANAQFRF